MKVVVSARAEKQLDGLTKLKQIAVTSKLQSVGEGGQFSNEEKLSGYRDMYRARVGDYRVVYKKTEQEIFVVLIGHRKEIYRLLERLLG